MTATPNFASNALADGQAAGEAAVATGAFVLNLCSSTTPMALAQAELPELRRFTFFVSRRFEEGRERFRLHMGYFATLAEAEEWLSLVREIYPGAWAGETPGRKLRERASAAAADQARFAAGPQSQAPPSAMPWMPAARPAAFAAPPARPAAQPAARQFSANAAPGVAARAAPPVVPTAASSPRVASPPARSVAPRPSAAPVKARTASPAINTPRPPAAPTNPTAARPPLKAPPAPAAARSAASAPAVPSAARRGAAVPGISGASRGAPPLAVPRAAKDSVKGVFQDSNVREVLKALADASATGETRLMPAPPAPPRPATPPPAVTPAGDSSLSDTQVLKLLDKRRTEGTPSPPAEIEDGGGISLLKPDDTQTRRALREAIATNAPVAFAVQLLWSVQAVELDKVPPLAIFAAYTLYTVEGSREGRKWYGLRLGFFSDAISAKQVAYYVRSEFSSVAVVPVSPQEKARATGQEVAVTMPGPAAPRAARREEFKLIDDDEAADGHTQVAEAPAARPQAPRPAPRRSAKASPPPAADAPPPTAASGSRTRGTRVGARDRRGPHTLDETLEILGASELSIDSDNDSALSDSSVRHLQVEVQKNSSFSRLLERLSERVKKP